MVRAPSLLWAAAAGAFVSHSACASALGERQGRANGSAVSRLSLVSLSLSSSFLSLPPLRHPLHHALLPGCCHCHCSMGGSSSHHRRRPIRGAEPARAEGPAGRGKERRGERERERRADAGGGKPGSTPLSRERDLLTLLPLPTSHPSPGPPPPARRAPGRPGLGAPLRAAGGRRQRCNACKPALPPYPPAAPGRAPARAPEPRHHAGVGGQPALPGGRRGRPGRRRRRWRGPGHRRRTLLGTG